MTIEQYTPASRVSDNADYQDSQTLSLDYFHAVSSDVSFQVLQSVCARSRAGLAMLISLVFLFCQTISAKAVIFWSTSDPSYNTTAPTGALAGSGWQYEGKWGSFLGTVIAPQYFVTAEHVG